MKTERQLGRTSTVNREGYRLVRYPEHHRANPTTGYVFLHVLIAEAALGRPLPVKHPVHHVNGRTADNHPQNLVICEDNAYHKLLHVRQSALHACGHASWRKCPHCQQYDPVERLVPHRHGKEAAGYEHLECRSKANRDAHIARLARKKGPVVVGGSP